MYRQPAGLGLCTSNIRWPLFVLQMRSACCKILTCRYCCMFTLHIWILGLYCMVDLLTIHFVTISLLQFGRRVAYCNTDIFPRQIFKLIQHISACRSSVSYTRSIIMIMSRCDSLLVVQNHICMFMNRPIYFFKYLLDRRIKESSACLILQSC